MKTIDHNYSFAIKVSCLCEWRKFLRTNKSFHEQWTNELECLDRYKTIVFFLCTGTRIVGTILKKERTIVGTILKNYNFFTERKNFPKDSEKLTIFSNTIFRTTIFLTDSTEKWYFCWTNDFTNQQLSEKTNKIDGKWTIILRMNELIF